MILRKALALVAGHEKDLEQIHIEKLGDCLKNRLEKDWIFLMESAHAEPMKGLN